MLSSLKRSLLATVIAAGLSGQGVERLLAQEDAPSAAGEFVAVHDPYSIGFDDFDLSGVEETSVPIAGSAAVTVEVDVDAAIEQQQKRMRMGKGSLHAQTLLGQLWLRKAKEQDYLPGYQRSVEMLEEVVAALPKFRLAKQSLAESYLAMHRFSDAARLVRELREAARTSASLLALEFDAHLELGNLEQARHSLAELQEIENSPPVVARQARLEELHGNHESAARLLHAAARELEELTDDRASLVWYYWRIGQLEFARANLDAARSALERALELDSGDEASLVSMAEVCFAESDLDAAERCLRLASASEAPPVLAMLGDLMAFRGQVAEARRHWAKALSVMDEEAKVAKVAHAREVAMFLADHQMDLDRAAGLAEIDFAQRQDAFAWDCRAWTAFRKGDLDSAQASITHALDGQQGSSQVLYHAARIALERGQAEDARKFLKRIDALNPNFSITAASELNELRRKLNQK